MVNMTNGMLVKKVFESGWSIEERFYLRARQSHIIANYIPTEDELNYIHKGHKVHMFMTNMNFMTISVLLSDFINDAYKITGHKVNIHIPSTKSHLLETIKAILWLNFTDEDNKFQIIPFNNPVIFKCSEYNSIDSIKLEYIDNKGLVCIYNDRIPQFATTSIDLNGKENANEET